MYTIKMFSDKHFCEIVQDAYSSFYILHLKYDEMSIR